MHAQRRGFFRYSYEITQNGRRVTSIADIKKEGCEFVTGGHGFRIERERGKRFVLTGGGRRLATAERRSGKLWTITGPDGTVELRRKSFWGSGWEVHANGAVIGEVRRDGLSGKSSTADLPDELPAHLRVFAFYMVLTIWARSDAAAAG